MSRSSNLLWKWEVLASISTVGMLIAVVALLVEYDGRPIFRWHGITLNTIVSVLSTIIKTTLLFAVAGAIGQWKWILFARQSRPLIDFEKIDSASRGPLGSAQLLWPLGNISLLRLGAIITVLTLALDPFAQQLVQYEQRATDEPLRDLANASASIPRAERYSKGHTYSVSGVQAAALPDGTFADADFSMQSAILYGLNQPYETIVRQTTFDCATGNCTWNSFESLAVCSVCRNLADQVTTHRGQSQLFNDLSADQSLAATSYATTFLLPNGLFIANMNGYNSTSWLPGSGIVHMTTYGTGNASKTVSMNDNDSLIWSMTFLKMQAPANASAVWPDIPILAMECALYYCVKEYTPMSVNGTLYEKETVVTSATRDSNSWQLYSPRSARTGGLNTTSAINSLEFNNITSRYGRSDLRFGDKFNVSQDAVNGISSFFQKQFRIDNDFNSTIAAEQNMSSADSAATLNGYYMSGYGLQYSPSVVQAFYTSADLNQTFQSIARSMSNTLRVTADNGTSATGKTMTWLTYYRISWPWISLQTAIVLATLYFVASTIYATRTSGVPIWKSSSLAPLSRSAEFGDLLEGIDAIHPMKKKASEHFVQLFGGRKDSRNDGFEGMEGVELLPPTSVRRKPVPVQHVEEFDHDDVRIVR